MIDEGLHAIARVLLRVCAPGRAFAVLTTIGGVLPPHGDRQAIVRAGARLKNRGTCLSRALAVAARAPDAELVIGVARPEREGFFAHAWLELDGEPLDASDSSGVVVSEIVRLGGAMIRRRAVSLF